VLRVIEVLLALFLMVVVGLNLLRQEMVGSVLVFNACWMLVYYLFCLVFTREVLLSRVLLGVGLIVLGIFLMLNISKIGALLFMIGGLLNCMAMLANQGKMPTDSPLSRKEIEQKELKHKIFTYISSLDTRVRLGFLGDRHALMGCSPGDLVVVAGILWMVIEGSVRLLHS